MIHDNIKCKEFWLKVQEEYLTCEEDETYFWLCERSLLFKQKWQDTFSNITIKHFATGFLSQLPESYKNITVGIGLLFTSKSTTVDLEVRKQVRLDFLKYMIETSPSFWEIVKQEYKESKLLGCSSPFICDNSQTFRNQWGKWIDLDSEIRNYALKFLTETKVKGNIAQGVLLFHTPSSKIRIQFLEYMTRKPKEKLWFKIKRLVYETFKNIRGRW